MRNFLFDPLVRHRKGTFVQSKHCDDYINDPDAPLCPRRFLKFQRWPATFQFRARAKGVQPPKLYATYNGRRVRVTMASRIGDVGITYFMLHDSGYSKRVLLSDLSEFNDKPSRPKT